MKKILLYITLALTVSACMPPHRMEDRNGKKHKTERTHRTSREEPPRMNDYRR